MNQDRASDVVHGVILLFSGLAAIRLAWSFFLRPWLRGKAG